MKNQKTHVTILRRVSAYLGHHQLRAVTLKQELLNLNYEMSRRSYVEKHLLRHIKFL